MNVIISKQQELLCKLLYIYNTYMKKLAAISLICIYGLATMGFSLKEFYCCGKLKTISVTLAKDEIMPARRTVKMIIVVNTIFNTLKLKAIM